MIGAEWRIRTHLIIFSCLWVGAGLLSGGSQWFLNFYLFFTFQAVNGPIYPVTIAMAWTAFLVVLYKQRRKGINGFLAAGSAPFGGAALYEISKDTVGFFHGWGFNPLSAVDLLVWIGVGLAGVYYWRESRAAAGLFVAFCLLFALWSLMGYPQISSVPASPAAFAFNILLKIISFLIFMIPLAWDRPDFSRADSRSAQARLQPTSPRSVADAGATS